MAAIPEIKSADVPVGYIRSFAVIVSPLLFAVVVHNNAVL